MQAWMGLGGGDGAKGCKRLALKDSVTAQIQARRTRSMEALWSHVAAQPLEPGGLLPI